MSKQLTPINLLTLVVCVAQHWFVTVLQIHETIAVWNDTTLEDITGSWVCTPLRLFYLGDVFYTIIGGLGIAIYRILIKDNTFAKDTIGLKTLSGIIFVGGIFYIGIDDVFWWQCTSSKIKVYVSSKAKCYRNIRRLLDKHRKCFKVLTFDLFSYIKCIIAARNGVR